MNSDISCAFEVVKESGFYLGLSRLQTSAGTPVTPIAPSHSGFNLNSSGTDDRGSALTHLNFLPHDEGKSVIVATCDLTGGSQVQLWKLVMGVRPVARIFQSTSTGNDVVSLKQFINYITIFM